MQLMPGTARQLEADPADLAQNIDAGTHLLRELLLKYQDTANGVRRALAAYNAGAGAVERFGGVPPFPETQSYVERVIELYWKNVHAAASRLALSVSAPSHPRLSWQEAESGFDRITPSRSRCGLRALPSCRGHKEGMPDGSRPGATGQDYPASYVISFRIRYLENTLGKIAQLTRREH